MLVASTDQSAVVLAKFNTFQQGFTMKLFKSLGLSAAAVVLAASGTAAAAELVVNGSFETVTNPSMSGKDKFFGKVPNWTGGGSLTHVSTAAAATTSVPNGTLTLAGTVTASPDGGKFVFEDADVLYRGKISQIIDGLLVGSVYTLTFYQASAQESFPTGGALATTQQWQVEFGADTVLSTLMNTAPQSVTPWTKQTFTFTATSGTQVLSFLALGGPSGAPPIAFLDGVSLDGVRVPEPATIGLMGVGMLVLGVARRRNRKAA
jgi:hypothetical protein